MDTADKSIIEKITKLAMQLPTKQKRQLVALISTWKKDIRRTQREKYTELLNFTSENGTHYGYARDINATGVFIECTGEFKTGEHVQLVLAFISAPNPVKLGGKITRRTVEGIGIQFDSCSQSQFKQLDSIISKQALILGYKK
jgi:Tfp pilus assembly protein PilZ